MLIFDPQCQIVVGMKNILFPVFLGLFIAPIALPPDLTAQSTTNEILITARKVKESAQSVPQSITVIQSSTAGCRDLVNTREASRGIPNLTQPEFATRRLSFPYVRGIGSGRNSPAIITCIDGIPQYSYATANQELTDIERVEFIRGPQSMLYGRNALGGVINIITRSPTNTFGGELAVTAGNYNLWDGRFTAGGVGENGQPTFSFSGGYNQRDGYTINDFTGNRLDCRQSTFGRMLLEWPDLGDWSVRLSLNGESARDGDYTLADLSALKISPYHVNHDYEGATERDIAQPAMTISRITTDSEFTSVTAWQWWRSRDNTDLDAGTSDLLRRDNQEEQGTWLQEFRWGSPGERPLSIADDICLRWLTGLSLFQSDYTQHAYNDYREAARQYMGLTSTYAQHDEAVLDDRGAGAWVKATFLYHQDLEFEFGLRFDYEHKEANLLRYTSPTLATATAVDADRDFNTWTPHNTITWHATDTINLYASAGGGYKAGGFNAQGPASQAEYGEETSCTTEAGVKSTWLRNRLTANATVFYSEWDDIQLDVADTNSTAFYIDNAGAAHSWGAEFELRLHPWKPLEFQGSIGLADSEFKTGSSTYGSDITGNSLPFAPKFTWQASVQYTTPISGALNFISKFKTYGSSRYYYDALNQQEADEYTLCDASIGFGTGQWRLEMWVKNIFDTTYYPVAFASSLATSGYLAESGAPRTYGVTGTYSF